MFVGIDVGASTTKAVIIDSKKEIKAHAVILSGADFQSAADEVFSRVLRETGNTSPDVCRVVSSGYGRRNVLFADATKTEISCHARGSFYFFPRAHTLIDIGGQDSKIIRISDSGKRTGFKMNRKCAAGTGAFLEDLANRLQLKMDDLDSLAQKSTQDIEIGSYCTVFTATEILTKIRQNVTIEDIIKGIFVSVIKRAVEMDPLSGSIVMSGGVVAHNPFLVKLFEERVGREIFVPPLPQLTGAFGAALYAFDAKGGKDA
jgi:predicted CoA-substrate-specific enzyme activase